MIGATFFGISLHILAFPYIFTVNLYKKPYSGTNYADSRRLPKPKAQIRVT